MSSNSKRPARPKKAVAPVAEPVVEQEAPVAAPVEAVAQEAPQPAQTAEELGRAAQALIRDSCSDCGKVDVVVTVGEGIRRRSYCKKHAPANAPR